MPSKNFSKIFSTILYFRFAASAALTFWFFVLLDMVSTMLCFELVPGVHETNPYARDAALNFLPMHHMVYNGMWFVALAAVGAAFYWGLKHVGHDSTIARVAAGVPLFYGSLHGIGDIISNFMVAIGWYN